MEECQARLVIGSDGSNSVIRSQMLGDNMAPTTLSCGELCYRGVINLKEDSVSPHSLSIFIVISF